MAGKTKVTLDESTLEFLIAEMRLCHALLSAEGVATYVGDTDEEEPVTLLSISQRIKLFIETAKAVNGLRNAPNATH